MLEALINSILQSSASKTVADNVYDKFTFLWNLACELSSVSIEAFPTKKFMDSFVSYNLKINSVSDIWLIRI